MKDKSFGLNAFSGVYLWLAFVLIFGILTPDLFLSMDTVRVIASSQAVPAILALALLIPMAGGSFDLSVGANANVAAVLVCILQTDRGMDVWKAIVLSVLAAAIVGFVNGFITVALGVPSIIGTLGMGSILAASQTILAPTELLPPTSDAWLHLSTTQLGGIQIVVLYMLIIALVVWWVLTRTPFGRYLYASGGNVDAARLSGIRTGRYQWTSLVISGGLSGLAGVLYAAQVGPSLTFGGGLLLPAFAAVFLGSTQIAPGRFNVWGTLVAIYVLATGVQGLQFVTTQQWLAGMFNGVALIGAVALAVWRREGGGIKRRPEPETDPAAEEEVSPRHALPPEPKRETTSDARN